MIKPMQEDLMVQQQIKGPYKQWKHMVAVMCLNLTYRKHVKIVLPKLFKPLGMWQVRSKRIRKMTEQYLTWDKKEASELHGIGKYGSDSYQIFFFNNIPPNVQDKELRKYIDNLAG
jgi:hypothetical protein